MEEIFESEKLLGGRMLSFSKSGYRNEFPDNDVYFNANIFVLGEGQIWYGDIDVTKEKEQLENVARKIGKDLYILSEMDGRFGKEELKPYHSFTEFHGEIDPETRSKNLAEFNQAKRSIETKSFEESKFTIAKQICTSKCLLTSQVKEIMLLFTFEQTRLDFAKFAYSYTYDTGNYFQVNDAFTFETSIDDLNAFIGGR
jgi:hypothetical protein